MKSRKSCSAKRAELTDVEDAFVIPRDGGLGREDVEGRET